MVSGLLARNGACLQRKQEMFGQLLFIHSSTRHTVHKARQEFVSLSGLACSYIVKAFYLPVASITYRTTFTGQGRRRGGGHAPQQWRAT